MRASHQQFVSILGQLSLLRTRVAWRVWQEHVHEQVQHRLLLRQAVRQLIGRSVEALTGRDGSWMAVPILGPVPRAACLEASQHSSDAEQVGAHP